MRIEEFEKIISDFEKHCEESLTNDKSYEKYIFDTKALPHPKNKIIESGILVLSKYLDPPKKNFTRCTDLVKNLFKLPYYQNNVGYTPFPLNDDYDFLNLNI